MIGAPRPDATQVARIHAWSDLGRTVKKVEKVAARGNSRNSSVSYLPVQLSPGPPPLGLSPAASPLSADFRAYIGVERNPNERTRRLAEEALGRLSAELEAGHSEARKNYLVSSVGVCKRRHLRCQREQAQQTTIIGRC